MMRVVFFLCLLGFSQGGKLFFKPYEELEEEKEVAMGDTGGISVSGSEYFYKHGTGDIHITQKEEINCPGNKSACPNGNTCCPIGNQKYGCCRYPSAVCCQDNKHCCPANTKCDPTKGMCVRGNIAISWSERKKARIIDSDGSSDDFSHSVLAQKQSSVDAKQELKLIATEDFEETLDIFRKLSATRKTENVHCDETYQCPDQTTCCRLPNRKWGCCPLPQAVCCSDGEHCCPSGYTCDVSSGKCKKGDFQLDFLTQRLTAVKTESVMCPDGEHECQDGQTCCKLSTGQWGCCPIPNAVCCSDGKHCCPSGHTCDVSAGTCNKGDFQMDWLTKVPARAKLENVVCPGGTSECPNGHTCCKLASGQYGCCPLPNAVCCSDGVHCCPSGYTCDVSSGTCSKGDFQMDFLTQRLAAVKTESVMCPDGEHECQDGQTCCKLSSGQWGCCPIPNAVCCSDGKHCCPSDTTCDVSSGKCNRGDLQMDWFSKLPATLKTQSVICPDGMHECQDGQTCCKLSSGQWGCCPVPNAVCCSDGKHCCPSGYTCNVGSGTCSKGDFQMDLFTQHLAAVKTESVMCPDGEHECQNGQTCCKLSSGQWGCCPIPNAVCCSDGEHCCPSGYTCNVGSGTCSKGDFQMDLFTQHLAAVKTESVMCPDGEHKCQDGQTCCKLASGQYGCCPLPNAVCCSDGVHCCPSDTTCDVSSGKCNRGNLQVEWMTKVPATMKSNVVKCDNIHECQDGQTCCKLSSGQWGCCPIPNAVCCSDGEHCCPSGYTCDVSSGKCNKGDFQLDFLTQRLTAVKTESVMCPDGEHECQDGQTCCKLSSGQWGCCPIPNAVCCSDGEHCCPSGYTCNVGSGTCSKGDFQMDLFTQHLAAVKTESVMCPDGEHECQDGQTCCKLESGQYGCCPLPNAVCCSDGIHCCPSDTTCDVSSGKCNRGDLQMDWFSKLPASLKTQSVICPDGMHECQDGQTCCKLASGQWGCCPEPNAVCCADGKHCCPSGYTCHVSSGTCSKGDLQMVWFNKLPAVVKTENVMCPDGQHECPNGNTCCKLASGQWGCCPLPKAVCCSDGEHCCPEGYACDDSSGKCSKSDSALIEVQSPVALMVVCPDGSECPSDSTCCPMYQNSAKYGCCPTQNAVCCSDRKHCCPHGYECNLSSGTCVKGPWSIPILESVAGKRGEDTPERNMVGLLKQVVCPNKKKTCPDGNICCENETDEYICCPYANGVCCKNSKFCCPEKYICDETAGSGICRIPEGAYSTVQLTKLAIPKNASP